MNTQEEQVTYQTLADMFTSKQRDNGDVFVCLKDDAPEWAQDFVSEAHGTEMLPDDYRYSCIAEALDRLAEVGDADADLRHEFAADTEIYNAALIEWLGSHGARQGYCDEAVSQGLISEDADIIARISAGQYMERDEIFGNVIDAAADYLTDEDEDED